MHMWHIYDAQVGIYILFRYFGYPGVQGLKTRLEAAFTISPLPSFDFFEGSRHPTAFKRLAFGLAYFHAAVQERCSYGAAGWTGTYVFGAEDLRLSLLYLRRVVDEFTEVLFPKTVICK